MNSKLLFWTPRILSIPLLLFLTMFSFDVISPELTFWQILIGMFMHNIPVFILAIILIIAWKHEIVGSIAFYLAGLLYICLLLFRNQFEWYMLSWSMIIAGPAFLIGTLFLIGWLKNK